MRWNAWENVSPVTGQIIPAGTVAGYTLRDLIWCGLCDVPMKPALLSTGRRFYGCIRVGCPRPVASADLLETLVWQAFRYRFAEPGGSLSAVARDKALAHALERTTVGVDLGDLRYQWRDEP
jgi:hypothetical protein